MLKTTPHTAGKKNPEAARGGPATEFTEWVKR
jgi:hypothetical protein